MRRQDEGFFLLEKGGKEQWKLAEKPFHSDQNDLSLSKSWGIIHAECIKFQCSF
jgi:hypothetical protein